MKAAKKRKRPIDVGSGDAEAEDDPNITEITLVYYKLEMTDEIIEEFKLSDNAEQEMCLRIIGEHFIRGEVKQLFMFITGIGGSGKSHVIHATVELFRRCSAAVLIDGYTIHALTFLPKHQAPIKQHDLEYICQVSHRICQAKSWDETARNKPFGGVNVIFASDFRQLRQTALHGTFLWCQVDVVVELKQNWRAKDDAEFIAMLSRIRLGKVRKMALDDKRPSDYDALKKWLLSEIKTRSPEQFTGFRDAPVIVTRKYLRDAINETKAIGGKSLAMDQQHRLWKLPTTNTNDGLGRLPLIPGMPIMITENTATSCKIVNGSRGILHTLHIPGLDNNVVPILPVTSSFTFPTSEKNVNVRRIQLPMLPGWAFTDFKVQGSYLPKVIVDLTGTRSLQSIYLSRASKLDNVAILHWFSSRTLHGELQGDA
ncbi:hypothetical protein EDB19DRAFT_1892696 [Suillus lakei]|nr:hypothetical protein EDB19DRAFT_1892696 [Suillus lakei]